MVNTRSRTISRAVKINRSDFGMDYVQDVGVVHFYVLDYARGRAYYVPRHWRSSPVEDLSLEDLSKNDLKWLIVNYKPWKNGDMPLKSWWSHRSNF